MKKLHVALLFISNGAAAFTPSLHVANMSLFSVFMYNVCFNFQFLFLILCLLRLWNDSFSVVLWVVTQNGTSMNVMFD